MSVRKLLRRSLPLALAALVAAPTLAGALNTAGRVDHATTYVARHQDADGHFPSTFASAHAATADAVLSFVASRQGSGRVERAMDWLEENVAGADNLGKKAKVVLAAVASGRDPRDLNGANLVEDIEATQQPDGSYASFPWSQVYDQALALLALEAAGADIPRSGVKWLAAAQCPDGGWQFDQPRQPGENRRCRNGEEGSGDFTETDTNTTGLALQALAAVPRSVGLKTDPFRWLQKRRDPVKGGWGYDRSFSLTDSASTSIVIQAYAAHDKRVPKVARRALRGLQRYCTKNGTGGFSRGWVENKKGKIKRAKGEDLGNSVAAILGLLQAPLPIEPKPYLKPLPKALPCDPIA